MQIFNIGSPLYMAATCVDVISSYYNAALANLANPSCILLPLLGRLCDSQSFFSGALIL